MKLLVAAVVALSSSNSLADTESFRATAIAAIAQLRPSLETCYANADLPFAIAFDVRVTVLGDDRMGNIISIEEVDKFGSTPAFRACVAASFKQLHLPALPAGSVEAFVQHYRMRSV